MHFRINLFFSLKISPKKDFLRLVFPTAGSPVKQILKENFFLGIRTSTFVGSNKFDKFLSLTPKATLLD